MQLWNLQGYLYLILKLLDLALHNPLASVAEHLNNFPSNIDLFLACSCQLLGVFGLIRSIASKNHHLVWPADVFSPCKAKQLSITAIPTSVTADLFPRLVQRHAVPGEQVGEDAGGSPRYAQVAVD